MNTTTRRDTVAVAMHAVTQHMVDGNLPAPGSIAYTPGDHTVRVHVFAEDVYDWLASLHVDSHTSRVDSAGVTRVEYESRLPDTGVRVTIMQVVLPLRSVTA